MKKENIFFVLIGGTMVILIFWAGVKFQERREDQWIARAVGIEYAAEVKGLKVGEVSFSEGSGRPLIWIGAKPRKIWPFFKKSFFGYLENDYSADVAAELALKELEAEILKEENPFHLSQKEQDEILTAFFDIQKKTTFYEYPKSEDEKEEEER